MSAKHLAERIKRYPAISDLQKRAKTKIPHVAWEYLEGGTGDEAAVARNLRRLA